jgi:hypothetical protein
VRILGIMGSHIAASIIGKTRQPQARTSESSPSRPSSSGIDPSTWVTPRKMDSLSSSVRFGYSGRRATTYRNYSTDAYFFFAGWHLLFSL